MKNFKPEAWMLPQPVLVIGTYDSDGTPNAMNVAWSGQWDMKEIMISMGNHQTTLNLNRCPDFTVAFATQASMAEADFVGLVSGRKEHDKISKTGWKSRKGDNVNAPVFDKFPMTLECRIKEKLNESESGYHIVAEILNIICDENYLAEDGKPDVEKMNLITFDPMHNGYIALGKRVGNAYYDGLQLEK